MPHSPSPNIGDHMDLLCRSEGYSSTSSEEGEVSPQSPDGIPWDRMLQRQAEHEGPRWRNYYSPLDVMEPRPQVAEHLYLAAASQSRQQPVHPGSPVAFGQQLGSVRFAPPPPVILVQPPEPDVPVMHVPQAYAPYVPQRRPTRLERQTVRYHLAHYGLDQTPAGQDILSLACRVWHTLPNNMVVARLRDDEPAWVVQDLGNKINWLRCGAWSHRSVVCRCVAILHVEALNLRILACGGQPIVPQPGLPPWISQMRVRPAFMRDSFYTRALRLNPDGIISRQDRRVG